MKIHQLPVGARFEFEGEEYVKTGPMFATGKGGQRLIPRHAILKVPGDAAPAGDALSKAAVRGAFEDFFATCEHLVPDDRRAALQTAREAFLKTLG